MHFFSGSAKPIRSVMLGWTEGAELDEEKKKNTKIKIKRTCNLKKTLERLDVSETLASSTYEAEWITGEDFTGGLSANWSDALPDLSDASGNST
ncbi:hypothetical protein V7S43_007902 [Phytophthora oleae]|uniref:Uncharacterized protein n=1 Tax=Phytophthora oleae TaxID=2107226 RepID=A0ABD3FMX4_9STRA